MKLIPLPHTSRLNPSGSARQIVCVFKVLPMVPMVYQYRSRFTIGTNGNANGTIGSLNGANGKPMVPLCHGTIGEPRTEPVFA